MIDYTFSISEDGERERVVLDNISHDTIIDRVAVLFDDDAKTKSVVISFEDGSYAKWEKNV